MAQIKQFFKEVKHELQKVTWPSLSDTRMLTLMVFIMVLFAGIFLWLVDMTLSFGINKIIGF